jgi:hypothetical protein
LVGVLSVSTADLLTALAIWGLSFGVVGFALGYMTRIHHDHHRKGH